MSGESRRAEAGMRPGGPPRSVAGGRFDSAMGEHTVRQLLRVRGSADECGEGCGGPERGQIARARGDHPVHGASLRLGGHGGSAVVCEADSKRHLGEQSWFGSGRSAGRCAECCRHVQVDRQGRDGACAEFRQPRCGLGRDSHRDPGERCKASTVSEMLELDLRAEDEAVCLYADSMDMCRSEGDEESGALFEAVLRDELAHSAAFSALIAAEPTPSA